MKPSGGNFFPETGPTSRCHPVWGEGPEVQAAREGGVVVVVPEWDLVSVVPEWDLEAIPKFRPAEVKASEAEEVLEETGDND